MAYLIVLTLLLRKQPWHINRYPYPHHSLQPTTGLGSADLSLFGPPESRCHKFSGCSLPVGAEMLYLSNINIIRYTAEVTASIYPVRDLSILNTEEEGKLISTGSLNNHIKAGLEYRISLTSAPLWMDPTTHPPPPPLH